MTIYFSKRDYREAMRNPHGADRAHAICRRLTVCSSQSSHFYGAHYWAGCAFNAIGKSQSEALKWYYNTFKREVLHCDDSKRMPKRYAALWRFAVKRVGAIAQEALALKNSMM